MNYNKLKTKSIKLQKAFLKLKNEEAVFCFLRDLLTEGEILEFSQRLEIAEMLYNGKMYKEIEKTTGASSTTVARVGKFLNGEFGGYRGVFK